ncbi:hypothetical protein A2U01_0032440, partial [Trifolium medium]|nr:hypothetical protein [Trifolium medium]
MEECRRDNMEGLEQGWLWGDNMEDE